MKYGTYVLYYAAEAGPLMRFFKRSFEASEWIQQFLLDHQGDEEYRISLVFTGTFEFAHKSINQESHESIG